MAMKWQSDRAFVQWLLGSQYAEMRDGKIYPYLTGGCVLYCYEAWSAGKEQVRQDQTALTA